MDAAEAGDAEGNADDASDGRLRPRLRVSVCFSRPPFPSAKSRNEYLDSAEWKGRFPRTSRRDQVVSPLRFMESRDYVCVSVTAYVQLRETEMPDSITIS
jgi:hypothetical protein